MIEQEPLLENGPPNSNRIRGQLPETQLLPEFQVLINQVNEAIENDIHPRLIKEGSSGSYFTFNVDKKIIGVFKPKNEEPYGKLNPKWLKWMHRVCCPCFFGRSCILPNKGYLSEAGAYIVDKFFELNIVPPTCITTLTSKNFNYSKLDRSNLKAKKFLKENFYPVCQKLNSHLPPKLGSFQKFVEDYKSAYLILAKLDKEPLSEKAASALQFEFEKLVILDYVIRNTDRNDNWLIKMEYSLSSLFINIADPPTNTEPVILIAAIDNGLAFPYKHPDSWRSYPYHWAVLSMAKKPFSERIKDLVFDKLSNDMEIEKLEKYLKELFMVDKGFDNIRFEDQMSVLRGQITNLCSALREGFTPEQLSHMKPLYVYRQAETDSLPKTFKSHLHDKLPVFKSF